MSQQFQSQPGQQSYQQPQQSQMGQQTQGFQQPTQVFQQSVPQEVSQAVETIEQFETDAEYAKTLALQSGDVYAAQELDDLVELVHLQKELIVRQSWHAPTVSQCVQQAIQHGTQELQQSQTPQVQGIAQQAQQLAQTIQRASSQATQQGQQMGGQQQGMGGQSQMGSQQF